MDGAKEGKRREEENPIMFSLLSFLIYCVVFVLKGYNVGLACLKAR